MTNDLLLAPQRQRCRNCRRFFGFEIVRHAHCSDACASADVSVAVEDLPRSCRRYNSDLKVWVEKRRFRSEREAKRFALRHNLHWYHCDEPDGCQQYHVATKRSG